MKQDTETVLDTLGPETEEELLARWPHLARAGPNWEELERRDAGLPPRPSRERVTAVVSVLLEHPEEVKAVLVPLVRQILEDMGYGAASAQRHNGRRGEGEVSAGRSDSARAGLRIVPAEG